MHLVVLCCHADALTVAKASKSLTSDKTTEDPFVKWI
jgi:hypothetical protein